MSPDTDGGKLAALCRSAIARSGVYRVPATVNDTDLELMRRTDELAACPLQKALALRPAGDLQQRCGHDGQRKGVAHMPTAATSTTVLRYGRATEVEDVAGRESN
jgi:hypothetical protein